MHYGSQKWQKVISQAKKFVFEDPYLDNQMTCAIFLQYKLVDGIPETFILICSYIHHLHL